MRHKHALDRLSFSLSFNKVFKTTLLPIKDHFLFYFPVENAGCPHHECNSLHLHGWVDGSQCRLDGRKNGRSCDEVIVKTRILASIGYHIFLLLVFRAPTVVTQVTTFNKEMI